MIDLARGQFRLARHAPWRATAILWCLLALWQPTLAAIWQLERASAENTHADCDHWLTLLAAHGFHDNHQFESATPSAHQHHAFLAASSGASLWLGGTTGLRIALPTVSLGADGAPRLSRILPAVTASRGPPVSS